MPFPVLTSDFRLQAERPGFSGVSAKDRTRGPSDLSLAAEQQRNCFAFFQDYHWDRRSREESEVGNGSKTCPCNSWGRPRKPYKQRNGNLATDWNRLAVPCFLALLILSHRCCALSLFSKAQILSFAKNVLQSALIGERVQYACRELDLTLSMPIPSGEGSSIPGVDTIRCWGLRITADLILPLMIIGVGR